MNKINMCALLLLLTCFVVSCSLVDESDTEDDGAEVSQARSDIQSDASEEAGQVEKAVTKLTKEEVDKLKAFVKSAVSYEKVVTSIYNDYIGASNDIRTYAGYDDKDESSAGNCQANWEPALARLKNNGELVKKFRELEKKMNNYAPQSLTDAIKRLEEKLNEDATKLGKSSVAREADKAYRDAIDAATYSYTDSFIFVVSRFSSGEFIEASQKLAEAARDFASGLNVYGIDSITYAVSGIVNEDNGDIEKAKADALKTDKNREGQALFDAIDELNAVFKAVKP
ncbi:hypothetical protein DB313_05115 (plasmid) [Borrelia turcica IST7]|uniref:Lipoprotein n=1 Tax=Borrelia turcica IST7 TaxID=1104446 RepID=A0A386PQB1_9SPIR|nr:hypothetical protein [Borrelia turcica]AYE36880.1 hypothetical protein DB313_05115 [Borrelia turcica IST7]